MCPVYVCGVYVMCMCVYVITMAHTCLVLCEVDIDICSVWCDRYAYVVKMHVCD